MGKDVIIACDFSSSEATFAFLDKFTGKKPFVKIGMELYYAEGPAIVKEIKARGHKIFLDLKLHDIPNTVKKAMSVLSRLDVDITNLHAAGTKNMMRAALEGLTREDGTRPLLIAVTQLTSTDQEALEKDILIKEPIDEVVMHYAETAKNAGLDGKGYSPHKLRHTAATLMYQSGNVDILELKELLGHANVATTQIYTHIENTELKIAAEANPLSKLDFSEEPAPLPSDEL